MVNKLLGKAKFLANNIRHPQLPEAEPEAKPNQLYSGHKPHSKDQAQEPSHDR